MTIIPVGGSYFWWDLLKSPHLLTILQEVNLCNTAEEFFCRVNLSGTFGVALHIDSTMHMH